MLTQFTGFRKNLLCFSFLSRQQGVKGGYTLKEGVKGWVFGCERCLLLFVFLPFEIKP